jgi:hypothetical protein
VPDYFDPPSDDDERVAALHDVLRSNGIGGPAPFTIEGEIAQMGHTASGTRRSGWRGLGAKWLVGLLLALIAAGVLVSAADAVSRLF